MKSMTSFVSAARFAVPFFVLGLGPAWGGCGGGGPSGPVIDPIPPVLLTDGSFSSGWTSGPTYTTGSGKGQIQTVATGGNPGAYLKFTISQTGGRTLYIVYNPKLQYLPSINGAVAWIQFYEDVIDFSGTLPGPITSLVVVQNGNYYTGQGTQIAVNQWTTVPSGHFISSSFSLVNPDTTVNPNSHPDFSATAPPITFGVMRSLVAGQTSDVNGLDNYSISVEPTG
jgi:hypothetical protein